MCDFSDTLKKLIEEQNEQVELMSDVDYSMRFTI